MSAVLPVIRVFSDDPVRRDLVIIGLSSKGQFICQGIDHAEQIPAIATEQPLAHCVIFDLSQPSPVLQAFCIYFAQLASIPAVVFVEFDDAAFMRAAIDAGLGAYVYAGLDPDRLHQVIEMARHRHGITSDLKAQVAKALAVARELGYFEEEGLFVTLEPQANWKVLHDRVITGELDGAHMLAGNTRGDGLWREHPNTQSILGWAAM